MLPAAAPDVEAVVALVHRARSVLVAVLVEVVVEARRLPDDRQVQLRVLQSSSVFLLR